jgi:glycosyltransferase involved in cell wall biosynthesis
MEEDDYLTHYYYDIFSEVGANIALAEYGPTAVAIQSACKEARIPLVVHFHGYDAHRTSVLNRYRDAYRSVFAEAEAIVAVSRTMRAQLCELGAPSEKVFINPCGVDTTVFQPRSQEGIQHPHFLAVGRLVGKKAPHLSLLAFSNVLARYPEARLTMVGDGELQGVCWDLAKALHIEHAVDFAGYKPHDEVLQLMRRATAFIQHSVQARDGDCEGSPVVIKEAGASGLPVVSTYHAGIPDIVSHGETGFLVEERDVEGMAEYMCQLASDREMAASMGHRARQRIERCFSMDRSVERLYRILQWAKGIRQEKPDLVPQWARAVGASSRSPQPVD